MQNKFLSSNFYRNKELDKSKIPKTVYYKLINPNSEFIAG